MKITTTNPYRTFVICRGATTADSPVVNPNANVGEYNQCLYAMHGAGVAASASGEVVLAAGELTDLSTFKGQEVTYTSTTDMAAWVAFNPILPNTKLLVSILNQPTQVELLDDELETYIVPIKGSVEVKGKTIEEFKSGRLLIGKKANLSVPEGVICAIVKVVREVAK